jgi:hypothetical protein
MDAELDIELSLITSESPESGSNVDFEILVKRQLSSKR